MIHAIQFCLYLSHSFVNNCWKKFLYGVAGYGYRYTLLLTSGCDDCYANFIFYFIFYVEIVVISFGVLLLGFEEVGVVLAGDCVRMDAVRGNYGMIFLKVTLIC